MEKLNEFSKSSDVKQYHGALVIGRQPNYRTVDAHGNFIDDPENNPGLENEGSEMKRNDFDTAVYILNEEVQVIFKGLSAFKPCDKPLP